MTRSTTVTAVGLLLAGSLTAQDGALPPPLHVEGVGEPVTVGVAMHRGYPAYPAWTLRALGSRVDPTGRGIRVLFGADTLLFDAGSPFFEAMGQPRKMVEPAYLQDGVFYLPHQLFAEWLPETYPDLVEYVDGYLRWKAAADPASLQRASAVRLFTDCSGSYCDMDHIRRATPYVEYVRDRHGADVYLFVASQPAGGAGGRRFTLAFEGQGRFRGMTDTITATTPPAPAFAEARATLTRAIQLGLMRYVARTTLPGNLQVVYSPPRSARIVDRLQESDPWHAWVFKVGVEGTADGEQSYRYLSMSGSVSARRTTEQSKIRMSGRASRFEQQFVFDDGTEYVDLRSSYSADALLVRSLGDHWSIGGSGSLLQATRYNTKRDARAALALEANVFSYEESSHREFVFLWELGANWVAYEEPTIFDLTEEELIRHRLSTRLNLQRPWGFIGLSLYGEALAPTEGLTFEDFISLQGATTYDIAAYSTVSVNLVRGLSFDVTGSYSKIGNQRYLPRGSATPEEILLRRRDLETNYRYGVTVGLSYTFGSIYNTAVNPRIQ